MGWLINCCNSQCNNKSWAKNIIKLIQDHRDERGWFKCSHCGGHGYIEKSYQLQEPGQIWEPYLRGLLMLGTPDDTYQPFVFLVSDEPNEPPNDVWFSYYKDTRSTGGRLKLGHGPGGPPVLETMQIINLLRTMVDLGCVDRSDIIEAIPELKP